MMMLSKRDKADLRYIRAEYRDSKGRAIHMSIDHVRRLLAMVTKLRRKAST
jgi:hypothetical protein